jgi:hypothetical protein
LNSNNIRLEQDHEAPLETRTDRIAEANFWRRFL